MASARRAEPTNARRIAVPAVTVAVLLVVWELVVRCGIVPNFLLPSPTQVIAAFVTDIPLLASQAGTTMVESFLGLAIGVAVGFAAAVLMDRFETIYLALDPLITISQTIPTVAIAPLLVLWFGYGLAPKVVLIVLTTFFPVAVSLVSGFRSVDPDMVDLLVDKGYDVVINDNFFYIRSDDGSMYGSMIVDEQQEMLEEEIKKPEYQEMLQELESADSGTYEPDEKDAAAEEDAASDSDQTDEDKTPADDDHPDGILQQIWSFIKALPDIVIGFFKSASELIKPVIDFFKSLWSTVTDVFS